MIVFAILAVAALTPECAGTPLLYEKLRDMVPDEAAAREVASAYIKIHYGEQSLAGQIPLDAKTAGDLWIVRGSRRSCPANYTCLGGIAEVRICRVNGQIVKMYMSK